MTNKEGIKRLLKAQKNKKDEFYTCYDTIENEIAYYKELLKGKIVYCNCDDWEKSNFVKYFVNHFNDFELSGLYATSYSGQIFNDLFKKPGSHTDNGKYFFFDGITVKSGYLKGNGDFRSSECIKILEKSDIVITNPPFSLLKDFIPLMFNAHKQFIILGFLLMIVVKRMLPYILQGKLKCGNTLRSGGVCFEIPEDYKNNGTKNIFMPEHGKYMINMSNVCWFTNVSSKYIKYEDYVFSARKIDEFDRIENFGNIINIDNSYDFPDNYYKPVAVPVTFFRNIHCNPEQFKILGFTLRNSKFKTKIYNYKDSKNFGNMNAAAIIHNENNKEKYRIVFYRMIMQRIR